jgi:hypothetical protein
MTPRRHPLGNEVRPKHLPKDIHEFLLDHSAAWGIVRRMIITCAQLNDDVKWKWDAEKKEVVRTDVATDEIPKE